MRRGLRYCLGKINRKSKKIVLTEAATGNYVVTPVIAAVEFWVVVEVVWRKRTEKYIFKFKVSGVKEEKYEKVIWNSKIFRYLIRSSWNS